MPQRRTMLRVSAAMGLLAVVLGAFGAHGLEEVLVRNDRVDNWETAVFYHFIHAVMLLIVALPLRPRKGVWGSFLFGTLVFSGSLYVLALTNIKWLGAITPIGGVAMIVGWAMLVWKPLELEPGSGAVPIRDKNQKD